MDFPVGWKKTADEPFGIQIFLNMSSFLNKTQLKRYRKEGDTHVSD